MLNVLHMKILSPTYIFLVKYLKFQFIKYF